MDLEIKIPWKIDHKWRTSNRYALNQIQATGQHASLEAANTYSSHYKGVTYHGNLYTMGWFLSQNR